MFIDRTNSNGKETRPDGCSVGRRNLNLAKTTVSFSIQRDCDSDKSCRRMNSESALVIIRQKVAIHVIRRLCSNTYNGAHWCIFNNFVRGIIGVRHNSWQDVRHCHQQQLGIGSGIPVLDGHLDFVSIVSTTVTGRLMIRRQGKLQFTSGRVQGKAIKICTTSNAERERLTCRRSRRYLRDHRLSLRNINTGR